ncbi:hypothetical protein PMI38_01903 [Pseudomonas sp. GM84]|nr:hypothetical protein [Pseudomonas sp. GM84]EJN38579.1 hypothetical protein PMI38_01903 [Pseudomonas sp. GM84]
MTSLIVVAVLALFVLITVFKGVRIVPQGEEWSRKSSPATTR